MSGNLFIHKFTSPDDCANILKALLAGERNVNDLSEHLKLSQYNVSKHLRFLKHAVAQCRR